MADTKKILIIEDDLFIRELYERQLQRAGFEVQGAEDGTIGIDKALANPPDLILLDIMLPKINGLDALRKLKESEKTKKVPVVLLTNLGQEAIIKEGFTLGAEGYLIKSAYSPSQIVDEVRNFLGKTEPTT